MLRIGARRRATGALTALMLATTIPAPPARSAEPAGPRFPERWVYCSTNLLVDQNVDRTIALIERAARSG